MEVIQCCPLALLALVDYHRHVLSPPNSFHYYLWDLVPGLLNISQNFSSNMYPDLDNSFPGVVWPVKNAREPLFLILWTHGFSSLLTWAQMVSAYLANSLHSGPHLMSDLRKTKSPRSFLHILYIAAKYHSSCSAKSSSLISSPWMVSVWFREGSLKYVLS